MRLRISGRFAMIRSRPESVAAMHGIVTRAEGHLKRAHFTGTREDRGIFRGGGSGNTLAVRRGYARASITSQVLTSGRSIMGVVGSPLFYVRVLEEGATITPKQARFLTIPTIFTDRYSYILRGFSTKGRGPNTSRLFRTFFATSKRGNLFLFSAPTRRGGQPVPLFILKRSVTIRPRRMFASTIEYMRPIAVAEFNRAITGAINASEK